MSFTDGRTITVGDAGVVRSNGKPISKPGSLCNFILPFAGKVLTGGHTGAVFDAGSGQVIYKYKSPLNCAAGYMIDGVAKVLIGTYTGEGLLLSQGTDGAFRLERVAPLHANAVKGLAASEGVLFSVCADGSAALHGTRNLSLIRMIGDAHGKIANGCTALSDRGFASVSRDRILRIWQLDGRLEAAINTPHTHSIKCVAASADGCYVATASYNGRIAVFELTTGTWVVDRRVSTAGISSIAAVPGGFSAAAYDGEIHHVFCL